MDIVPDNLRDLGLYLPLEDLFHLAITDKRCYRELFEYDHFWSLYSRDQDRPDNMTWREHYRLLKTTWFGMVLGDITVKRTAVKISARHILPYGQHLVIIVTWSGEVWFFETNRGNVSSTRVKGIEHLDVVEVHRYSLLDILVETSDGGLYEVDPLDKKVKRVDGPMIKVRFEDRSGTSYHYDTDDTIWRGYGPTDRLFTHKEIVKVEYNTFRMMVLDSDGVLWCIGDLKRLYPDATVTSEPNIYRLDLGFKVKDFSSPEGIIAVIDIDMRLWMCGDNNLGRLGMSPMRVPVQRDFINVLNDVKMVCCNRTSTIAICSDNTVWCAGDTRIVCDEKLQWGFVSNPDLRWSDVMSNHSGDMVMYRRSV